jgi:GNAT superfamily N-acetyltransferase
MSEPVVRRARPDEAAILTDLAMRGKATWGYDQAFMDACRKELTITPELMAAWRFWVAEVDGEVAGMIALDLEGGGAVLEDFFVEPRFQRRGVGAALMAVLLQACGDAQVPAVELDADPNAEDIYLRMGFTTIGRSPSGSIPGRTLPRMRLVLDQPIRAPSLAQ